MRGAFCGLAILATACAHAPGPYDRSGFVDVASLAPGVRVDMRYYGSDNFVGRPIAGYQAPVCLLAKPAAAALARVQTKLEAFGLSLKVFDCYRPQQAVADFAAWARDPADQTRKAANYPNVEKSRLFELGYIAETSGHSRGSTLDLTLVDHATGSELDMGSAYDLFDVRSWPSDQTIGAQARANRMALQAAMTAEGFQPLKEEWWHFTLKDEPYPKSYFNFPVTQ